MCGNKEKTTLKAAYIYQDRAMNWALAIYGNPNFDFYPARIGASYNDKTGVGIYAEYNASGAVPAVSYF